MKSSGRFAELFAILPKLSSRRLRVVVEHKTMGRTHKTADGFSIMPSSFRRHSQIVRARHSVLGSLGWCWTCCCPDAQHLIIEATGALTTEPCAASLFCWWDFTSPAVQSWLFPLQVSQGTEDSHLAEELFKAQRIRMAKHFVIKMTCFGSKAERNTFKNRSSWAQHGAATSADMNFPDVCPQFTHSSSRAMLFPRQGHTRSSPAKRGGSSWDAEGKPWGRCAVWRTNTLCKLILY